MNTPKLHSLLSSPPAGADISRRGKAADPVHGLDFSRLLGEKRSSPGVANRRVVQSDTSSREPQARHTPARPSATQSASQGKAVEPRQSGAAQPQTSPSLGTASEAPPPATAEASPQQASSPPADAQGSQSNTASHAGQPADAPGNAAHSGEQATQLAQAAAEAGLPGLSAAPLAVALPIHAGAAQTQGQAPAIALPQPPPTGVEAPAITAGLGAAGELSLDDLPATAAAPHAIAAGVQSPQQASAPTLAGIASPTGHPFAGPQGAWAAVPPQAVQAAAQGAPSLPAAQALRLADPAMGQAPSGAIPPATVLDATPVAKALSVVPEAANPVVLGEAPESAASLSLQDFTAMMTAARETSGTSLPLVTGLSQAGLTPQQAMAGLMPGGIMAAPLTPGQPSMATPLASSISAPLGSAQWPTELGRQFIHIAKAATGLGQVAELRLDPPELGPLRITINLNDNVAHAVFSSPHAQVRQTVENALPQLQQMLEQAGISLGQANVNDQHQPGQSSDQPAAQQGWHTAASEGEASGTTGPADTGRRPADPNALVDTFA